MKETGIGLLEGVWKYNNESAQMAADYDCRCTL